MIESIKLNNEEYNKSLDNEISPDGPYNEAEIIKLNSEYEEAKNKNKKAVSLTSHIEETSRKKKKYIHGAVIPLEKCYDDIIGRIKKILTSVPDATLEKALFKAFLLMCPDGAFILHWEKQTIPSLPTL